MHKNIESDDYSFESMGILISHTKQTHLFFFYCLFILSALHYSVVCLLRSIDSWLGSGNISGSWSTTEDIKVQLKRHSKFDWMKETVEKMHARKPPATLRAKTTVTFSTFFKKSCVCAFAAPYVWGVLLLCVHACASKSIIWTSENYMLDQATF